MNSIQKNNDLINIIQQKYDDFSKGQKLIANYIVNHYDKAAYVTAAKLGEIVGVSESTVVRFAIELGFDGYPKLQKVLQELIKSKLTAVQRIEVSSNRINEDNILKSVMQSDMDKIKITLEQIDNSDFNNIVETILGAKRIFILGVRSSAPLASFLGFYFNLIFDNVRLVHTTSVSEMFEQIIRARAGDVVIGVSFPRYSKRTINAMQFAKKQGVKTIALTDSAESPVAKSADLSLLARSDMASFVDSLVAPLSLINALIVAIGMRRKNEVYNTFEKLEKIWDEYQVYEKDDGYNDEKL
ncbi:MurR/RpiR family transcriptional regulator [Ruminiclostridium cellobioparum]|uniref:Transcriptional regulator n=1 Tax=Ruminiclostridium cellobioparum subsp. termitidis CT1112 TaxID=1195236 RepID=S0FSD5_RUMCE|nr:MurR/RpiR family transcriptional regulator [Ruminiclostridium cellobioparum]EMS73251.1 transcriptional regulator [Ruminiclostridium cellobioparum subsp. termitidis CT1112]